MEIMMALTWDGNEIDTLTGANRRGKDASGKIVVVSGTHEAVDDFGWRTIWQAAETKYANGIFEQNGEIYLVNVTTTDCQAEESDNA
jgi:hypothetical protein